MPLNLTRIAFGAQSLDEIRGWFKGRGDVALLTTRYMPKRHAELIGGSLFWIYKHQLVTRSPILRFEPAEDGKTHIVIAAQMIPVRPQPKRAHQGWRYLAEEDAPADLAQGEDAGEAMPVQMVSELAKLGLV